jgi:hypothetical protein
MERNIVAIPWILVARMTMLVVVHMRVPGPISMYVLMVIGASLHRLDLGRLIRSKVGQRHSRDALATACRAHQTSSSISMLLIFSSSPLSR